MTPLNSGRAALPYSGLMSPRGGLGRQEAYLSKIASEKRNLINRKFTVSGEAYDERSRSDMWGK